MAAADFLRRSSELADAATPLVVVTLIEATGSTPADTGAKMLVTADGLEIGTVGGGRVEAKAIDEAITLLKVKGGCKLVDWSLKADVGMTCGGRVKLFFEPVGVADWPIVVFGAGHVTQALAAILVRLPCQLTCIDPRNEWLAKLPKGVRVIETSDPPAEVDRLPDNAFVLCMTQGHKSDLPVLVRLFQSDRTFPYVGVIGSKAKAAVLRKELKEAGVPVERAEFHCPVGLQIGTNHPVEIAVSITAQLIEVRDALALKK
ncbi:xanthine dehydrogenase accessory protein XdhC [Botrimarina mediterranea]|uniref:XdhC and CoxI family protein n=1 Tax=Botrimarina mediterranea TaxID=2528022 RepID=A0A518K8P3_9BACT|nr:xanthine dehydrogenase accessory protein XdhC [Botrimarina mediterranea]QDV74162.1 XdhC and CoxI family protein [Botrimarina mediterranea]QDV78793.1 XdhC and CoxI family protein [Planctomycetes bacterium K2D]